MSPSTTYNGARSEHLNQPSQNNSHSSLSASIKSSSYLPNVEDEITDEEDLESNNNTPEKIAEYSQFFEDNKSQILQVLPNLTKGMDLTKVKKRF